MGSMKIDIDGAGIVWRKEGGEVVVLYAARNGAAWREVGVAEELADELRLSSGDILDGARLGGEGVGSNGSKGSSGRKGVGGEEGEVAAGIGGADGVMGLGSG